MKRNDGLLYADGVLLKDEFSAQIVADEIFKEDCYRLSEIPQGLPSTRLRTTCNQLQGAARERRVKQFGW